MKAHEYTCNDFAAHLANGPYAWPGGYPLFFWGEGFAMCFGCARDEKRRIRGAIRRAAAVQAKGTRPTWFDPDWLLRGVEVNWEDAQLCCDHCSQVIECAYPESEVAQ